jgi:hypothetical protein
MQENKNKHENKRIKKRIYCSFLKLLFSIEQINSIVLKAFLKKNFEI